MSNRSFLYLGVLAAAVLSAPVALAAGDGFRALANGADYQFVGTDGALTREAVKSDLKAAQDAGTARLTEASPSPTPSALQAGFTSTHEQARQAAALHGHAVPSDGWRDIGGEAGWTHRP